MRKISIMAALAAAMAFPASAAIDSFPIGTTWPDTDGVHINCHGGCVVEHDGAYYWFGESRTGGHSDGISVYKSSDLYNWENLGYAVVHQGERDDENMQDISEGRLLERPKVIYNAKTGKWVMWAHWENGNDYGQARVAILQADKLTGPYTFVKTMRPNGHDSRDQTLFLDTDGHAYHLCSTNMNTDINLVRLSDDFLDVTPTEQYIMKGRRLEASTVCKAGETYFATFSECNGWNPAPGHTSTAVGDIMGEWTEGLNFCVDPGENQSYRSQGAYVFSVGGLGYDPKCFIFYGDRWNSSNVGGSTYVWLPLSVRSGYPTIRNYSTWNLDDVMKSMYRFKRSAKIESGNTYSLLDCNSNRLLTKIGRFGGFRITDNDDKGLRIVFEATDSPYRWLLRDAESGRYLCSDEGKLRETSDKNSEYAVWTFILQKDGHYKVFNEKTALCMATATNGRNEGTEIELSVMRDDNTQKFGVYFDSDEFKYQEADMFSKKYFDEVAAEIARQNFKIPASDDKSFVAGKPVTVVQPVSRMVLSFVGPDTDMTKRRPGLAYDSKNKNQIMTFVAVGSGASPKYNIKDEYGYYLFKTSEDGWTGSWASEEELAGLGVSLTDPAACFGVTRDDEGYHIVSSVGMLGTDDYNEYTSVWMNKSGGLNTVFTFRDPDAAVAESDRSRFLRLVDEADIMLGEISEDMLGTSAFDYSKTAYERMHKAFLHALDVTSDYVAETEALSKEMELFRTSALVAPHPGNSYYIVHDSGRYLGLLEGKGPALAGEKAEEADRFRFLYDEEADAYTITHKTLGTYLAKGSGDAWTMEWREEPNEKRTLWRVEWSPLGKKAIYNLQTKAYLGCDELSEGAALYGNKDKSAANSQWSIMLADNESVSGIDADAVAIYTVAGGVRVAGVGVKAEAYTLTGIKAAEGEGDDFTLALPAGIYAVKAVTAAGVMSRMVVVAE